MKRSNVLAGLLALSLASPTGCGRDPADVRAIRASSLPGCPLDDVVALELSALDDGPPSAAAFAEVLPSLPTELPSFPAGARAFVARGRDAAGALVALGVFDVDDLGAHGPLFRVGRACSLLGASGAARAPALPSPSVGASDDWVFLAGGREPSGVARSDLLAIDARAATVSRSGLRRRRAGATVLVFDGGAAIAGGESDGAMWEDAEWIDTTTAEPSVTGAAIALAEPRAMAAGVRLVSGEGLLVGGVGPRGPLATLEAIDPVRRTVRTVDLARLAQPRRSPVAVRLVGGAIAVLGGFDASGAPVPDVEIFDAAAARRLATFPLAARAAVTAIALPSGAALVVRADPGGPLEPVLVRVDGIEALPVQPAGPAAPRLVRATDGAPFLWDGVFRRYDPWTGELREAALPASFAPDLGIEPLPMADGAIAVARAGDEATLELAAVRYDVRTPWVVDPEPLGLGSTAHLVPDRLDVRVGREGLVLGPHARVAVADAVYGAFTARLGASGRALPAVELRTPEGALVARIGDEGDDGDDAGECRWPAGLADVAEISRSREGAIVVRVGDATSRCTASAARVTIALVAGAREARVRGLTITRG